MTTIEAASAARVMAVGHVLEILVARAISRERLSVTEALSLRALLPYEKQGALGPVDVAACISRTPSGTARALCNLIERGLLVPVSNARDWRQANVYLAPCAVSLARSVDALLAEIGRDVFAQVHEVTRPAARELFVALPAPRRNYALTAT